MCRCEWACASAAQRFAPTVSTFAGGGGGFVCLIAVLLKARMFAQCLLLAVCAAGVLCHMVIPACPHVHVTVQQVCKVCS